jgi:hypothetical protein
MNDRMESLTEWLNSCCDTRYPECVIERLEEANRMQEEYPESLGIDDEISCLKEILDDLITKEIVIMQERIAHLQDKRGKYCEN